MRVPLCDVSMIKTQRGRDVEKLCLQMTDEVKDGEGCAQGHQRRQGEDDDAEKKEADAAVGGE